MPLRRTVALLALAAAAAVAVLVVVSASGDDDREEGPPMVTLAELVAEPERYAGKTVVVAGKIRRRKRMSYELVPPDTRRTLLVRRQRPEFRPYARRGDRVEVIGEVRMARPGAPKRVVAELVASEVLLYDRADEAPREI